MKKGILLLVIGLCSLTLVLGINTIKYGENKSTPDSGWDYDYGGGSDYSGSSDWGSSSSESSSGSSHKCEGVECTFEAITGIVVFGIIVFVFIWQFKMISIDEEEEEPSENEEELIKILNNYGISYDYVIERAFEIYKEVQNAWMNFDLDTLRKDLSDELYNEYAIQLETLKNKNQQNIMKDVVKKTINLNNVTVDNDVLTLVFSLSVSQKDYVVDINKPNKPLRGDTKDHNVSYNLRFTMTPYKDNYCPNCGNKLDNKASTICSSCGSVVVNKNHDLVMVKKQITHQ